MHGQNHFIFIVIQFIHVLSLPDWVYKSAFRRSAPNSSTLGNSKFLIVVKTERKWCSCCSILQWGLVEVARIAVCTTSGCWDRQTSGEIGTLRVLAGSGPTMPFCPFGSVGCCFISTVCRLQEECRPTWRMEIVWRNSKRKKYLPGKWKPFWRVRKQKKKTPYGSRDMAFMRELRVHVFCVRIVSGPAIGTWPSCESWGFMSFVFVLSVALQ